MSPSKDIIHIHGFFLHKAFGVNDEAQIFQAQHNQLNSGIVDIETPHDRFQEWIPTLNFLMDWYSLPRLP